MFYHERNFRRQPRPSLKGTFFRKKVKESLLQSQFTNLQLERNGRVRWKIDFLFSTIGHLSLALLRYCLIDSLVAVDHTPPLGRIGQATGRG